MTQTAIKPAFSPDPLLTIGDIRAAAARLEGAIVRTPTLCSQTLSAMTGAEVWLKFENLQFTAAYKERGALNKLLSLSAEERGRGVIAASAGNHAQGLAYHARRLGIPITASACIILIASAGAGTLGAAGRFVPETAAPSAAIGRLAE